MLRNKRNTLFVPFFSGSLNLQLLQAQLTFAVTIVIIITIVELNCSKMSHNIEFFARKISFIKCALNNVYVWLHVQQMGAKNHVPISGTSRNDVAQCTLFLVTIWRRRGGPIVKRASSSLSARAALPPRTGLIRFFKHHFFFFYHSVFLRPERCYLFRFFPYVIITVFFFSVFTTKLTRFFLIKHAQRISISSILYFFILSFGFARQNNIRFWICSNLYWPLKCIYKFIILYIMCYNTLYFYIERRTIYDLRKRWIFYRPLYNFIFII